MIKRYLSVFLCLVLFSLSLCACSSVPIGREESASTQAAETETTEQENPEPNKAEPVETESSEKTATLLYMGQASIRIVTTGEMFDRDLAEQFEAKNRLIVIPGEELKVE